MPYPTAAEIVGQSAVPELTSLSAGQLEGLRAASISAVEGFTGQKFEPWTGTLTVPASGGRELFLPRRIEEVTAVVLGSAHGDLTNFALSADGSSLMWTARSTHYAVRAMLLDDPWADARTFRTDVGHVSITGRWGWSQPPAEVMQALRIDMEEQAQADASGLAGSIAAYRRMGVTEVAQGNLRVGLGPLSHPLSLRAQSMLAHLVWVSGGVRV
jgi:hypothetical protein